MELTTDYPKYQDVIPKRMREQFGLAPGQLLQVLALPGQIELVPNQPPCCVTGVSWWRQHLPARTRPPVNPQRAVVDSSGWIDVVTNGPLADRFLAVLEAAASLMVPAISIVATARAHQAGLSTMDADFKDLHEVDLMTRS
ncbi:MULTISPECIES: hypothetical protein [Aphanothece]|uniref:hypothetical protein n=1 Tax=Aphanothece TaxID=1121 RepID=UPI0039855300